MPATNGSASRNASTGSGRRTAVSAFAANEPRKPVWKRKYMNTAKNSTCENRRTQTSVRIAGRAGIPEPVRRFFGKRLRKASSSVVLAGLTVAGAVALAAATAGAVLVAVAVAVAVAVVVVVGVGVGVGGGGGGGVGVGVAFAFAFAASRAGTSPMIPFHGIGATCACSSGAASIFSRSSSALAWGLGCAAMAFTPP